MAFQAEQAFQEISNGNPAAFDFLCRVYMWFHRLDDLIDQDVAVSVPDVLKDHFGFIVALSCNEFFQTNRNSLIPFFLSSSLSYQASEKFKESSEVLVRIGSQVLKSQYQDIFYHVAWLVGGYDHAVAMNGKWRGFDFDAVPPPVS